MLISWILGRHLSHMVLQFQPRTANFINLVLRYIEIRGAYLTIPELIFALHLDPNPNHFDAIVETGKERFPSDGSGWNMFRFFCSCYLLHIICGERNSKLDPAIWAPCVMKVFGHDVLLNFEDINKVLPGHRDPRTGEPSTQPVKPHPSSGGKLARQTTITPLQLFMTSKMMYPLDTLEQAERWLSVLHEASVDVDRYLEIELLGAFSLPFADSNFRKPEHWETMDDMGKLESIFDCLKPGQRLAAEDGTTDDLLAIMPALRYSHFRGQGSRFPNFTWNRRRTLEEWKALRKSGELELNNGPVILDLTTSQWFYRRGELGDGYRKFYSEIDDRYDRKQSKKFRKLMRLKDVSGQLESSPGSFEARWQDYRGGW